MTMVSKVALAVVFLVGVAFGGCKSGYGDGGDDFDTSCKINGFGQGECEFHNLNDSRDGKAQAVVTVRNHRTNEVVGTAKVLSGIVKAGDIRTRDFSISGIMSGCSHESSNDWTENCVVEVTP
jgi:hypothetical protein